MLAEVTLTGCASYHVRGYKFLKGRTQKLSVMADIMFFESREQFDVKRVQTARTKAPPLPPPPTEKKDGTPAVTAEHLVETCTQEQLIKMARKQGIKANRKWTKVRIAKAITAKPEEDLDL